MRVNLLEGFGDWLKTINVSPKYGADQHILLANVTLDAEDGSEPIHYPQMTMFKIVKSDPNARWARIMDASTPDPKNRELSDFPHALGPSKHAGRTFLVQGKEFDKLIQSQLGATPGGPTI